MGGVCPSGWDTPLSPEWGRRFQSARKSRRRGPRRAGFQGVEIPGGRPARAGDAMPSLCRLAATDPRLRPSSAAMVESGAVPRRASSVGVHGGPAGDGHWPAATAASAAARRRARLSGLWVLRFAGMGWRQVGIELGGDPGGEGEPLGARGGDVAALALALDAEDDGREEAIVAWIWRRVHGRKRKKPVRPCGSTGFYSAGKMWEGSDGGDGALDAAGVHFVLWVEIKKRFGESLGGLFARPGGFRDAAKKVVGLVFCQARRLIQRGGHLGGQGGNSSGFHDFGF